MNNSEFAEACFYLIFNMHKANVLSLYEHCGFSTELGNTVNGISSKNFRHNILNFGDFLGPAVKGDETVNLRMRKRKVSPMDRGSMDPPSQKLIGIGLKIFIIA
jgi:hypothetical protein